MFALLILNFTKVTLGNLGNKSESSDFLGTYFLLSIGSILGYIYFMVIQTFVLELEFIINLFGLVFATLGIVFGFIGKSKFAQAEKNMYY